MAEDPAAAPGPERTPAPLRPTDMRLARVESAGSVPPVLASPLAVAVASIARGVGALQVPKALSSQASNRPSPARARRPVFFDFDDIDRFDDPAADSATDTSADGDARCVVLSDWFFARSDDSREDGLAADIVAAASTGSVLPLISEAVMSSSGGDGGNGGEGGGGSGGGAGGPSSGAASDAYRRSNVGNRPSVLDVQTQIQNVRGTWSAASSPKPSPLGSSGLGGHFPEGVGPAVPASPHIVNFGFGVIPAPGGSSTRHAAQFSPLSAPKRRASTITHVTIPGIVDRGPNKSSPLGLALPGPRSPASVPASPGAGVRSPSPKSPSPLSPGVARGGGVSPTTPTALSSDSPLKEQLKPQVPARKGLDTNVGVRGGGGELQLARQASCGGPAQGVLRVRLEPLARGA
jgi:hypothetical protein